MTVGHTAAGQTQWGIVAGLQVRIRASIKGGAWSLRRRAVSLFLDARLGRRRRAETRVKTTVGSWIVFTYGVNMAQLLIETRPWLKRVEGLCHSKAVMGATETDRRAQIEPSRDRNEETHPGAKSREASADVQRRLRKLAGSLRTWAKRQPEGQQSAG